MNDRIDHDGDPKIVRVVVGVIVALWMGYGTLYFMGWL